MIDGAAFVGWLLEQGPTFVLLAIFMFWISTGRLRTPQEIAAMQAQIDALKERVKRAEDQVDKLIPAMDKLGDAITVVLNRATDRGERERP